jgi:alkylation response protein AidB-like acyl-CoA dehydrogenase
MEEVKTSAQPQKKEKKPAKETFGSLVPFAEPAWYQGWESPYYGASHKAFRSRVRNFVESIRAETEDWDEDALQGKPIDLSLFRRAWEAGVYAPQWPAALGGTPPEGGFDAFHDVIWLDELGRLSSSGMGAGFTIYTMALPPLLLGGSQYLKDKVAKDVITAKKFISLAISEPYAGSDVANIRTTATRDGDFYIVTGEKKWITFAKYADYFTVAVRTGGAGAGGISLLLLERTMPGITVRPMKLMGAWSAGTSYLSLDNVKVPVANLIGVENQGFKLIMHNFNHERFVIIVQSNRSARICLEESITYARQRTVFGQPLIASQVIRHKIAEMASRVQGIHAMIETVAYQMRAGVASDVLGGPIALLKVQSTKAFEYCAREAAQIFGGASYVREGKGKLIERMYREVRGSAIPGGSEEIMLDLAMRQSKL